MEKFLFVVGFILFDVVILFSAAQVDRERKSQRKENNG